MNEQSSRQLANQTVRATKHAAVREVTVAAAAAAAAAAARGQDPYVSKVGSKLQQAVAP